MSQNRNQAEPVIHIGYIAQNIGVQLTVRKLKKYKLRAAESKLLYSLAPAYSVKIKHLAADRNPRQIHSLCFFHKLQISAGHLALKLFYFLMHSIKVRSCNNICYTLLLHHLKEL